MTNKSLGIVFFLKYSALYSSLILLFTIFYVSLFQFEFLGLIDILFFKSYLLQILVSLFLYSSLLFARKSIKKMTFIDRKDCIVIALLFFMVNNILYGLVPFNVSRSVSVMVVGYFYQNQGRDIDLDEVNLHIHNLYFVKESAVNHRLEEQVAIGNLEKVGQAYRLTEKGRVTAEIMGGVANLFNVKKNYMFNEGRLASEF